MRRKHNHTVSSCVMCTIKREPQNYVECIVGTSHDVKCITILPLAYMAQCARSTTHHYTPTHFSPVTHHRCIRPCNRTHRIHTYNKKTNTKGDLVGCFFRCLLNLRRTAPGSDVVFCRCDDAAMAVIWKRAKRRKSVSALTPGPITPSCFSTTRTSCVFVCVCVFASLSEEFICVCACGGSADTHTQLNDPAYLFLR